MRIFESIAMTKPVSRILSIIFQSDLHGIRAVLGLAELVWFVTLIWPGATFDRPTYRVMSGIMSEESWALLFLCSGITQCSILYRMDFHSRFSTYFAAWNLALWLYVVISMYISVAPPPAAISGDVALVLGAAWIWIRSGYAPSGRRSCDQMVK